MSGETLTGGTPPEISEENLANIYSCVVQEDSIPARHGKRFALNVNGIELGLLRLKPRLRTLEWDGNLDFEKLEEELLEGLKSFMSPQGIIHDPSVNDVPIDVTISYFNNSNKSQTLVFGLNKEDDKHFRRNLIHYEEVLSKPERIIVARYDVGDESFGYTGIAENPKYPKFNKGNRHLKLKFPSGQEITPEVLSWMVGLHSDREKLLGVIDIESSASVISQIR